MFIFALEGTEIDDFAIMGAASIPSEQGAGRNITVNNSSHVEIHRVQNINSRWWFVLCWLYKPYLQTCTACFPCSPPNGNIKNFALH
jgi:hypothetical protein